MAAPGARDLRPHTSFYNLQHPPPTDSMVSNYNYSSRISSNHARVSSFAPANNSISASSARLTPSTNNSSPHLTTSSHSNAPTNNPFGASGFQSAFQPRVSSSGGTTGTTTRTNAAVAAVASELVGSSTNGKCASIGPDDCCVPHAGDDGITSLIWNGKNHLVSTNWDGGVRCWEVKEELGGKISALPRLKVNHENNAPVLSSVFSPDGSFVFSTGADNAIRMSNLAQTPVDSTPQKIGTHDKPATSVAFIERHNLVVSSGWDKTVKIWDAKQPSPVWSAELPERCYGLDVRGNLMVVLCAGNGTNGEENGGQVICYNMEHGPREIKREASPLSMQTRSIAAFPDGTGYIATGIQGRVAVQYLNDTDTNAKKSFRFKCHRQADNVYAVNNVCFHPKCNGTTFATMGSDGIINFWDMKARVLLKKFDALHRTVPCANFNAAGDMFAYASSYDWSKGSSFHKPGNPNEIWIHKVTEHELSKKK